MHRPYDEYRKDKATSSTNLSFRFQDVALKRMIVLYVCLLPRWFGKIKKKD